MPCIFCCCPAQNARMAFGDVHLSRSYSPGCSRSYVANAHFSLGDCACTIFSATLDGQAYDFQGTGTYLDCGDKGGDFEVQTCLKPWYNSQSASVAGIPSVELCVHIALSSNKSTNPC